VLSDKKCGQHLDPSTSVLAVISNYFERGPFDVHNLPNSPLPYTRLSRFVLRILTVLNFAIPTPGSLYNWDRAIGGSNFRTRGFSVPSIPTNHA